MRAEQIKQSPRKWVVYLLPHSHVDIGYTHVQTEVEQIQRQIIDQALDLCQKTADYPPEARFKWNVEALWVLDIYLRDAPAEKQRQLLDAVRSGRFSLDAFYCNQLTGLCRPEELLYLMQRSITLGRQCGVKIESATIGDVPGYTWGLVSAMAQAGVKYFSIGPNLDYRIGHTLSRWQNKPFYWLAPDGRQKVLCWVAHQGYTFGMTIEYKLAERLPEVLQRLEQDGYPYDIVQLHWTRGDNRPPDDYLPEMVKKWNAEHEYPRLVIANTAEMFHEFERRYGDKLPVYSGDWTGYWEDGAASSARETALARNSAERLVQAEVLWTMHASKFPSQQFADAWRNVLLFNEHTWGARQYNVVDYDVPFIVDQWKIKQAFAMKADQQSRELLAASFQRQADPVKNAVDVLNTVSWTRTELVVLSKELSAAGDLVVGPDGRPLPSQRLTTGELAFLARNVPGMAGRRYIIRPGNPPPGGRATAASDTISTSTLMARLDPESGAIASLRNTAFDAEFCDWQSGVGLNRYLYVRRDEVTRPQQVANVKFTVKESGPLVASLVVESDAPGCTKLYREIRLVDGLEYVDILNTLNKTEMREKEGVHLGFAFNVPEGQLRIDIPWAVFRPEIDQLPGACKNWLSVGRWADVSNAEYGVTWATIDAPLIEVGAITANKLGQCADPALWLDKLEPTQTFFSYVMNNYWDTNYRAFQSGPTSFRYSLLPHGKYDQAAAQRFGIERSQPLLVVAAHGPAPSERPMVQLDTDDAIVASIKPSADGKARIIRVFAAAGRPVKTTLQWHDIIPKQLWLSNLAEERVSLVEQSIDLPPYGLVTLRAE